MIKNNMEGIIIGGKKPSGTIRLSGAKNSATRLLAASLISNETIILKNFPTKLVDAKYKIEFIKKCGGDININHNKETLNINSKHLEDILLDNYNYPIRTTYLLVPGLIKKSGRARIPYPGGCKIGKRGYDLHIMVWEKLGAKVTEKNDYIEISAPKGFNANEIDFPISTIGGTENALICASTINSETIIRNAYVSPEVENLISFLKTIGAEIEVIGNSYIKVIGNEYLKGSIFSVMPDRIEAITWIIYGILSGGEFTIKDIPFSSMQIPLIHLQEAGIDFYRNNNNIRISPECLVNGIIQPFEVATGTHPGIISDMQPFFVLLGLHADGISRVFDYRYPERLQYLDELSKFYPGQLEWKRGEIIIKGSNKTNPKNATVQSTDLRGSMALVIAGLLANGKSNIKNIEMALRGYNNLKEKLNRLGITVQL